MLSKRLNAIASFIDPCIKMCDVGSDHALLPVALLASKKIQKAIVVEVANGPLDKAKNEVASQGFTQNVDFYLSNGLKEVDQDMDCVVIAGMGYDTISMIISESYEKFKKIPQIILQSNSKHYDLRQFMNAYKFKCIDEDFIQDRNRSYIVMKYIYDDRTQKLSETDYLCGPILMKKNNVQYKHYLLNLYQQYSSFLKNDAQRYQSKVECLKLVLNPIEKL